MKKIKSSKLLSVLMIVLMINLPLVSAIQISNVQVTQITENSVLINWQTDEKGDSFVRYGTGANNLAVTGDASSLMSHLIPLGNLKPETTYVYKVESNGQIDDNSGNLYSFKTLPPDTQAPTIQVQLPETVKGDRTDITGTTEVGATVNIFLNELFYRSVVADTTGNFTFIDVLLVANTLNNVTIAALDAAGNEGKFSGSILSDNQKPLIQIAQVPVLVGDNTYTFSANVSESVTWEILLNNKSVGKGESTEINQQVSLNEGDNKLQLTVTDAVGYVVIKEIVVSSDTQAPVITAQLARGNEYYQGNVETDITGKTEPGSKIYLYTFKPSGIEQKPDFKKAREVVTADVNGEFILKDVNIESTPFNLKDLAPREIPSDLLNTIIYPVKEIAAQEQFSVFVYLIAEDKSGKVSQPWQQTVSVHSCTSPNLDFAITSVPEFQGPLRLVPNLMDDGRQDIQAVFELNYNGQGDPKISPDGVEIEPGFKVRSIKIDKACTQSMQKDPVTGTACKILPGQPGQTLPNADLTSHYVKWKLLPTSGLSERDDDFWDDLKKRQLVFPLKITVNYQERVAKADGSEQWTNKFQTTCTDVGYQVDVPIDSKELIPDFLANEGIDFLNETVTILNDVTPIIETAYLVAGVGCMSFTGLRLIARLVRQFWASSESRWSIVKTVLASGKTEETRTCPIPSDQNKLYLHSTMENWYELLGSSNGETKKLAMASIPTEVKNAYSTSTDLNSEAAKKLILDDQCPQTASLWKFEAAMDQAFKWACDRAFCRAVPAGWTATENTEVIGAAILQQNQCAVTGRGIPLVEIENCENQVKLNYANIGDVKLDSGGTCWRDQNTVVYYKDDRIQTPGDNEKGFFKLSPIGKLLGTLELSPKPLLVYKPQGSDSFIVGRDQTCEQVCKSSGRDQSYQMLGCYDENPEDNTLTKDGKKIEKKSAFSAGYTRGCFIKEQSAGSPILQQCVCVGQQEEDKKYQSDDGTRRTAIKEVAGVAEDWSYRQATIFKETRTNIGTYYPPERYYQGRDLSGAFGADYILDYANTNPSETKVPKVDPSASIVETFQTVCLSGILKNLKMLEAIATGLRNCLIEAKHTGFHDAGQCKALFTQHVCGLVYKAVAYANNGCSPINSDDVSPVGGVFGEAGLIASDLGTALSSSLESSIQDLRDDYGNAQLNNYFQAGAQGFAQSICMGAFGFEVPLFSKDFLLDAAYAFPMQSSLFIAPTWREFSTYNPAKSTAVYNYEIGGSIFPGCKIKRYDVKLKCIGPEDTTGFGVDTSCGGQGCDCLNAQNIGSPFEGERVKNIKSDTDLPSNQLVDLQLESPLRIDSHFRYDHVVVEMQLDAAEKGNEDKCIDKQAQVGNKAVYYYPIKDVSPPLELGCVASPISGQFECKEIATRFGFGGAYLEQPFVTCFNKKTGGWSDCANTPNLFTLNDQIKVRVHINNDNGGKCLLRTVRYPDGRTEEQRAKPLPENAAGQLFPEQILGTVQESFFGGSTNIIQKVSALSNPRCEQLSIIAGNPAEVSKGKNYKFSYIVSGDKVKLLVPAGATPQGNYNLINQGGQNFLVEGSNTEFTIEQINEVHFEIEGFIRKNVLGNVLITDENKYCVYETIPKKGISQKANAASIQVTYQILEKDEGGSCKWAKHPVKTSIGKPQHTQTIKIQRSETAFQEVGGLHNSFMTGNYDVVLEQTTEILNDEENDLTTAIALYYHVGSYVMLNQVEPKFQNQIEIGLKRFFEGKWFSGNLNPFPPEVKVTTEYRKIDVYLREVSSKFNYVIPE